MKEFPSPHGDKLRALLENENLPIDDKYRVKSAIEKYNEWLKNLKSTKGTKDKVITKMLNLLNEYKLFIDVELTFDSSNNFLYRQKGQLKIDNTIIEEFLPIIINALLYKSLNNLDVSIGPTTCFSGIRFESSLAAPQSGGGMRVREKDQDFAICRNRILFIFHGNYTFTHPGFLVKPGMTHLENGCNCHSCESRNPCLLNVK
ncbi:MAG: Bpu10I family restriction endonuclease [Magnetococcales bacterium]|nr:Bpu10I family restriction endonuclease [Nitrospirota bacterium]